jgi:hypothetical protein
MRKVLVLSLVSAFAAACGGSSNDGPSSTPVTGTIAGHAFTPADVKALLVGTGTTPCTIPNLGTAAVKAFAVEMTSYANACGDFASASCAFHPNAQTVTLLFARLNALPPYDEPALSPGTYPIAENPAGILPDGTLTFRLAYAQAIATDATCNANNPTPLVPASGGSVRIDSATGPITGHITVSFVNPTTQAAAGTLAGDFSAPLCSQTVDVCGLAELATAGGTGGLPPPELFCSATGATCGP